VEISNSSIIEKYQRVDATSIKGQRLNIGTMCVSMGITAYLGSDKMVGPMRKFTTIAVAASLMSVTTASIAATPAPAPAPATTTSQSVSPWIALGAMNGSTTAASVATAQDYRDDRAGAGFPPLPVLAIILATLAVGIWILVQDNDDDDPIGQPISPN
jgi:hypothetical protein